jgi:hypothetical protein
MMKFSIKECTQSECHQFEYLGEYCSCNFPNISTDLYKCTLCGLEAISGVTRYDFQPVHYYRRSSGSPWKKAVEETFEEPAKEPVQEFIELPKVSRKKSVYENLLRVIGIEGSKDVE